MWDAQRKLKVVRHGKLMAYSHKPVHMVVTPDRCVTYKHHNDNTKAKTGIRNSILNKLANTNWGTYARTIHTTALALCFSSAEYAPPVWSRSPNASKIDPLLNAAYRAVFGCLRPTGADDLYLLCGIAPPPPPPTTYQTDSLIPSWETKQENDYLHPLYEK